VDELDDDDDDEIVLRLAVIVTLTSDRLTQRDSSAVCALKRLRIISCILTPMAL